MEECLYCHARADTVDHVWPRSRGGDDNPNNLIPACRHYNSSKGNKSILDDCCPGCLHPRSPGDVDTESQVAYYACRCGHAWTCRWDLQKAPMLLGIF